MNSPLRNAGWYRAPMYTWPRWARWLVLLFNGALLVGGLFLMVKGNTVLRVLGLFAFAASMPLMIHANRAVMRERSRPIEHRYAREFMPAMLVYMLVMLYVWPLQKTMEPGWLKVITALSPVLPVAWTVLVSIRYVLGSDELERRQHLEALAIGVAIVSVISMTLGFLGAAHVLEVDGVLTLLLVYPALCLSYGLAHCVMLWRHHCQ
jgi:hypothetical protein